MDNPFSWDYLTAPVHETPTFGPFSIFYLVLFGVVFLTCAYLSHDAPKRFSDHKLKRDTITKGALWLMWVTGVGLFFFLVRALQTEILTLEKRIWMYLTFLVFLGFVGYFAYYLRAVYPVKLAEFERRRERRKYHVSPSSGTSRSRSNRRKGQRVRG